MHSFSFIAAAAVVASIAAAAGFSAVPETPAENPDKAFVLDHEAARIDGTQENLAEKYAGKVILVVNVASRCGYTKQYKGLEAIYQAHKDDGLVVLGFPANDFGKQEPGSNSDILAFCQDRFDVTFPMFEKVQVVKGEDQHPLYKDLTTQPEPIGGDPKWNFTKFLIGRDGKVVARFNSGDEPEGKKVMGAVAVALEAKAP